MCLHFAAGRVIDCSNSQTSTTAIDLEEIPVLEVFVFTMEMEEELVLQEISTWLLLDRLWDEGNLLDWRSLGLLLLGSLWNGSGRRSLLDWCRKRSRVGLNQGL